MPFEVHVRSVHSTLAEDVAIKTAFDVFVASCKSATTRHIDAGGTQIGLKTYAADEANPHGAAPGTVW
jgi:hypothetical protein